MYQTSTEMGLLKTNRMLQQQETNRGDKSKCFSREHTWTTTWVWLRQVSLFTRGTTVSRSS